MLPEEDRGSLFDYRQEQRFFSPTKFPEQVWGRQVLCSMRAVTIFPAAKTLRREADHSPASSAGVKHKWNYTATTHTLRLMADVPSIICGLSNVD